MRNFAFLLLEGFEGHVGDELRGLAACLATDDKESGKIRRLANASQQNMELRVVVEDFNRNSESRGPPVQPWGGSEFGTIFVLLVEELCWVPFFINLHALRLIWAKYVLTQI